MSAYTREGSIDLRRLIRGTFVPNSFQYVTTSTCKRVGLLEASISL
jgi:hypothetical protein